MDSDVSPSCRKSHLLDVCFCNFVSVIDIQRFSLPVVPDVTVDRPWILGLIAPRLT